MAKDGEVAERHFWKFMWPGFQEKMFLPPDFCTKFKGEISKHAILETECGRNRVGVRKNNEGEIYFKEGWKEFVQTNGLVLGNILVFEHTGGFHFNVIVFDETGCERELQQEENRDNKSKLAETNPTTNTSASNGSSKPRFTVKMKTHHGHEGWANMSMPSTFLRSNDMSKKTSATLRVPNGNTWKVNLSVSTTRNMRCMMSKGWSQFYASNNLKCGDECVFEVHPHSPSSTEVEMNVKIFRGRLPS